MDIPLPFTSKRPPAGAKRLLHAVLREIAGRQQAGSPKAP